MEAFNIKFVGEIEKHPELYDYTTSEYSRKDCQAKGWHDVSMAVNLPVNECKEKWRNVRTTFVRRMKNSTSGSKPKKPYYLSEAMQFTIPFVKTCTIPSGNLPPIPSEHFETADAWENSEISEYPESDQTSQSATSSDMLAPLSPNTTTSNSIPVLMTTQSESEPAKTPKSTLPKSKPTPGIKVKRNKKLNSSFSDAGKAFAEYFKTKKAKLATTPSDARTDSVKQFLNSLMPDLLSMSDAQLRTYKRRSIGLIDEILCTPPIESLKGERRKF